MEKPTAVKLLRSVGGAQVDALIRFGYVTKTGDYALVEGILVSWTGDSTAGDYRGVRVRVVSTTGPVGDVAKPIAFALDRIREGERIRAERRAAKRAAGSSAGQSAAAPCGIGSRVRRPSERAIRYAFDLHQRHHWRADVEWTDEDLRAMRAYYAAMDAAALSMEIDKLKDYLDLY